MEDALVGDGVDDGLGGLEQVGGLGLVAGRHGLLHVLDDRAEFGTQCGVRGVELDVLAGALATRRQANRLFLGFGAGCHAVSIPSWCKDGEYSMKPAV
ncbi:hypothetical protein ACS95_00030 [Bacillus cereus]|nr:hypothetical protein ACS95_00030 [Bacillus cereus]